MLTNIEYMAATKKLQRQITDALKVIEPSAVLSAFANVCLEAPRREDGKGLYGLGAKLRRLEMKWRRGQFK